MATKREKRRPRKQRIAIIGECGEQETKGNSEIEIECSRVVKFNQLKIGNDYKISSNKMLINFRIN